MQINRYKLKPNLTKEQLIKYGFHEGGSWINQDAVLCLCKCFIAKIKKCKFEFSIDIAFTEDINIWNDFDNVIVLDEDFCQLYTPFYNYLNQEYKKHRDIPEILPLIIKQYNEYMDSLDFLEKIK